MRFHGLAVTTDVPAGRYFLIRLDPTRIELGDERYMLCSSPGRTNQSHEVRLSGWLGTTNDVAKYAEGAVEVYQDRAKRWRIRRTNAKTLLAQYEEQH